MIKANEVREGNYFYDAYGNIGQAIIDLGCFVVQSRKSNSKLHDGCRPIPLTPEILEKSGFERLPNFNIINSMVKYLPRKRHLSFGCIGTPNEMLFIQEMEDDENSKSLIVLHNYDYDGYMHLHQLQNLYFALTGEELEIQL